MQMSLAEFIQKFKKLRQLFDWHNLTLLPKVDVYFGKGKAPLNVQSPHAQQMNLYQRHSQNDSGSLFRAQSMTPFQSMPSIHSVQSMHSNPMMNGMNQHSMYNPQQLNNNNNYSHQQLQQQQHSFQPPSSQQITYSH